MHHAKMSESSPQKLAIVLVRLSSILSARCKHMSQMTPRIDLA